MRANVKGRRTLRVVFNKSNSKIQIFDLLKKLNRKRTIDKNFENQKDKISYHTNWCGTGFQHYSVSKNIFPWNELF